ncbi:hypothetical protein CC80DRAFT_542121 [Byssothecium circinans]|uniref:Uncharacterized protein n=1 Tax=Byssothecium circinans TaxID=147558 RepID=A0A6A5UDI0_9PLEO|nr:hypothetical protein CC80DRAFT_542121 [Byssothecium circinans]
MTHSHYMLMGGFAVDVRDIHPILAPKYQNYPQLTLRLGVFKWLNTYVPECIPKLLDTEIQDKSLSISLLELNTFAHAICALISYAFWFQKPLDIAEPTLLPLKDIAALLAVVSRFGIFKAKSNNPEFRQPHPPLASIRIPFTE